MNPEPPNHNRDKLERRLTAFLLGELPPDETADVQQALEQDAELAALCERLKQTIELVRESAADPAEQTAPPPEPLKLSSERREQLLARFKTIEPKELERPARRRMATRLLAVAALVAFTAVLVTMMFPESFSSMSRLSMAEFSSENRSAAVTDAPPAPSKEPHSSVQTAATRPAAEAAVAEMAAHLGSGRTEVVLPKGEARPSDTRAVAQDSSEPARPVLFGNSTVHFADSDLQTAPGSSGTGTTLGNRSQGELLNEGTVTTLSGRQAERKAVDYTLSVNSLSLEDEKLPALNTVPVVGDVPTLGHLFRADTNTQGMLGWAAGQSGNTWARGDFVAGTAGTNAVAVVAGTLKLPDSAGSEAGAARWNFEIPAEGKSDAFTLGGANTYAATNYGMIAGAERLTLNGGATLDNMRSEPIIITTDPALPASVPSGGRAWTRSAEPFDKTKSTFSYGSAGLPSTPPVAAATPPPASAEPKITLSGITTVTGTKTAPLETRRYPIDPKTLQLGLESSGAILVDGTTRSGGGGFGGGGGGGAGEGSRFVTATNGRGVVDKGLNNFYDSFGVNLDTGAGKAVAYDDKNGTIVVRATPEELAKIEAANQTLAIAPPQINVAAKFVDVSQSSNPAPGYDRYTNYRMLKEGGGQEGGRAGAAPTRAARVVLPNATNGSLAAADEARGNSTELALKRNEEEIRVSQEKLSELRKDLGLSDIPADQNVPTSLMTAESMRHLEAMRIEAEAQRVKQEAQLNQLKFLNRDDLRKTLPAVSQDNQLNTMLGDLEVAQRSGARADAEALNRKIDDRIQGALIGMEVGLDSQKKYAESLKNQVEKAKEMDVQLAEKAAPYFEAQRKLEEQKRFSQQLNEKILSEKELAEQKQKVALGQTEALRLGKFGAGKAEPDAPLPKPAPNAPVPQPEILARENAFSTFSLNVSDVSFKLAAASLEQNVLPDAASIRSEEFINAFDYRDPEPTPGAPVAFTAERARYPFAHNRDLLRFSLKTAAAGRQPGRPLNLVLLLDNSGSMERADRVRIIREALQVLAGQLQPQDKFSLITFARTPRLWVDGVPGTQAGAAAEEAGKITPEGGTNLGDALDLAYTTALRHYLAAGVNRVVVLTDGAANLGNVEPATLKQRVEAHRKQGIALDCFGIGWEGFNDDLLEVLSRNGDGRYGFINTPEEAASGFAAQLAGALNVAASDVKVQVEFNPSRVTAYRQVGYAKHQLTKEQFRDNTVDAAEIAAAESGNALYVVDVNPSGEGPLATVRVRYKVPGTGDYREQEWAVPYAGNAVALEQAGPAMRLAATASAFSEWLAASPYAGDVTPSRLLNTLGDVPGVYGADSRPKKLEWMIRQAGSISGK